MNVNRYVAIVEPALKAICFQPWRAIFGFISGWIISLVLASLYPNIAWFCVAIILFSGISLLLHRIRNRLPFSLELKECWNKRTVLRKRYFFYGKSELVWLGLGMLLGSFLWPTISALRGMAIGFMAAGLIATAVWQMQRRASRILPRRPEPAQH